MDGHQFMSTLVLQVQNLKITPAYLSAFSDQEVVEDAAEAAQGQALAGRSLQAPDAKPALSLAIFGVPQQLRVDHWVEDACEASHALPTEPSSAAGSPQSTCQGRLRHFCAKEESAGQFVGGKT